VLIAALTALVDAGPGDLSVDALVGKDEWGPSWALGGLAVGGVAAALAVALGRSGDQASDAPPSHGVIAEAAEGETAGDPVTAD
jgi:putative oxidoreductase